MLDVPVVLIVFNRPDKTRRTLDAIRKVAPTRLFVLADGPRSTREGDAEKCAAVREELAAIDWDCKVQRRYAERNIGCDGNTELGLDWVFSQVDRAILFDDDCVPDPTFFRFATELLERHADDHRVWMIAGNGKEVPRALFGGDSYAFATLAAVWGWATWSRAWQVHRAAFTRDHTTSGDGRTAGPEWTERPLLPRDALATAAGHRYFTRVAEWTEGRQFDWGAPWRVSMMSHGGIAITPAVNMVENIGMGPDADQTVSDREQPPAKPMDFPLNHPKSVALNPEVARAIELEVVRADGRLARKVGRILGHGRLRTLAREISTSGVTRRIVRAGSAAASRLGR